MDRQVGSQTDGQVSRQLDRQVGRWTDGQAGRQVGRWTDRQAGRQVDRWTGPVCMEKGFATLPVATVVVRIWFGSHA